MIRKPRHRAYRHHHRRQSDSGNIGHTLRESLVSRIVGMDLEEEADTEGMVQEQPPVLCIRCQVQAIMDCQQAILLQF